MSPLGHRADRRLASRPRSRQPKPGPSTAQKSAEARIDGLLTGIRLFQENPLSGIGPGAWREATDDEEVSESVKAFFARMVRPQD